MCTNGLNTSGGGTALQVKFVMGFCVHMQPLWCNEDLLCMGFAAHLLSQLSF